jgi:hypothetical protein
MFNKNYQLVFPLKGHIVEKLFLITTFYITLLNFLCMCNNKENIFVKRDDEESKSTFIFLQRASVAEKKQKIVD